MILFRRRARRRARAARERRRAIGPTGWTCHICGDYRPGALIAVQSRTVLLEGLVPMQENTRYCADREACAQGALDVRFPPAAAEAS